MVQICTSWGPFKIPPEAAVKGVSSCCIKAGVARDNVEGGTWDTMYNRTSLWDAVVGQISFNEMQLLLECTIDVINFFAMVYGSSNFALVKGVFCVITCAKFFGV